MEDQGRLQPPVGQPHVLDDRDDSTSPSRRVKAGLDRSARAWQVPPVRTTVGGDRGGDVHDCRVGKSAGASAFTGRVPDAHARVRRRHEGRHHQRGPLPAGRVRARVRLPAAQRRRHLGGRHRGRGGGRRGVRPDLGEAGQRLPRTGGAARLARHRRPPGGAVPATRGHPAPPWAAAACGEPGCEPAAAPGRRRRVRAAVRPLVAAGDRALPGCSSWPCWWAATRVVLAWLGAWSPLRWPSAASAVGAVARGGPQRGAGPRCQHVRHRLRVGRRGRRGLALGLAGRPARQAGRHEPGGPPLTFGDLWAAARRSRGRTSRCRRPTSPRAGRTACRTTSAPASLRRGRSSHVLPAAGGRPPRAARAGERTDERAGAAARRPTCRWSWRPG